MGKKMTWTWTSLNPPVSGRKTHPVARALRRGFERAFRLAKLEPGLFPLSFPLSFPSFPLPWRRFSPSLCAMTCFSCAAIVFRYSKRARTFLPNMCLQKSRYLKFRFARPQYNVWCCILLFLCTLADMCLRKSRLYTWSWNSAVPDPNVWCCILLFFMYSWYHSNIFESRTISVSLSNLSSVPLWRRLK